MDRLILFRHGKAENESASGEDFDRHLAKRGVKDSAEMAESLARLGLIPDLVLISPSARTRETWAAAEAAFPDVEARLEPDLYHAEAGAIREVAERAGASYRAVMVVGHNPGLQELAVDLLREGCAPPSLVARAQRRFPTAAAAVFLIDGSGRPSFDGLFYPERGD